MVATVAHVDWYPATQAGRDRAGVGVLSLEPSTCSPPLSTTNPYRYGSVKFPPSRSCAAVSGASRDRAKSQLPTMAGVGTTCRVPLWDGVVAALVGRPSCQAGLEAALPAGHRGASATVSL